MCLARLGFIKENEKENQKIENTHTYIYTYILGWFLMEDLRWLVGNQVGTQIYVGWNRGTQEDMEIHQSSFLSDAFCIHFVSCYLFGGRGMQRSKMQSSSQETGKRYTMNRCYTINMGFEPDQQPRKQTKTTT